MTQTLDLDALRVEYDALKAKNLSLDLTRGKPSTEQLDFNTELLGLPEPGDTKDAQGADVRNYGNLKGIVDIRQIWADLLNVSMDNIIAQDSSSLNIMFDLISWAYMWGTQDSQRPWKDEEHVKWLCPVPGYDRHFSITETFGFEMVPVEDVNEIPELVKDPQVKGMWVVPIFANPSGTSLSPAELEMLASMETAAPDFRVFYDNAYAVHTLNGEFPQVVDVVTLAAQKGNPNRFFEFASTSKITFAGAGVSFLATSADNLAWWQKYASMRGIGPNKVNQLAHARYLKNADGVKQLMLKHCQSLAPKFSAVEEILERRLGAAGVARWTTPKGGYFISLDVVDGTASRVVDLAAQAGIKLTGAGSSFPLHKDPNNRNIRLAPSLPPLNEVTEAMDGVATCVLLAAAEAQ
ncbi:MAG: aminotransferase class I/II-fold pyridoxal phosphate-dependent enzyme [Corynebacterium sp.]|nr:aminotransferase class I/II-fold pyridoxal phosphate-dependent enzyme [Corynebacterium sp.]